MVHLNFAKESDFTMQKIAQFQDLLNNQSTVVLNHATWCGHCHAFMGEFDKFKRSGSAATVKIESEVQGKFAEYPGIYKKITPAKGSMYFPMVLVFVNKRKSEYKGERTKKALKDFVDVKTKKK